MTTVQRRPGEGQELPEELRKRFFIGKEVVPEQEYERLKQEHSLPEEYRWSATVPPADAEEGEKTVKIQKVKS